MLESYMYVHSYRYSVPYCAHVFGQIAVSKRWTDLMGKDGFITYS